MKPEITTGRRFADDREYVEARRAYIRALARFGPNVSNQEAADEAAGMSIAILTLAEKERESK